MTVEPESNGIAPPIERHAPWCSLPVGLGCTCRPIPALRCDACGTVYEPDPGESPIHFAERAQAHASLHLEGVTTFTQGKVSRTLREPEPRDRP